MEIFQPNEFLWKFFIKAAFFGLSLRHFLVEISNKSNFLWKFPTRRQQFLWKFFNKTEYFFIEILHENSATLGGKFTEIHAEGSLRQNSVNFGENFRKIHQTAKISAQLRCHAARVFVTLGHPWCQEGHPWGQEGHPWC